MIANPDSKDSDKDIDQINIATKNKREQYVSEIRRSKMNKLLNSKRSKVATIENNKENTTLLKIIKNKPLLAQEIKNLVSQLISEFDNKNFSELYETVKKLRILISADQDPPLAEFLQTGVIVYMIKLLDPSYSQNIKLQYEVLWIITNVLSGSPTYTKEVFNKDFYHALEYFLYHIDDDMVVSVSFNFFSVRANSLINLDFMVLWKFSWRY